MDWMMWVTAAAAYVGAGLSFVVTRSGVRQRERADLRAEALEQRAEWGRRLDMALGELASGADLARRFAGRAILESLVADEAAPAADRALADRLARSNHGPSPITGPDGALDWSNRDEDNGENAGGSR